MVLKIIYFLSHAPSFPNSIVEIVHNDLRGSWGRHTWSQPKYLGKEGPSLNNFRYLKHKTSADI